MRALYRKPYALPSLALCLLSAWWHTQNVTPNRHLEALQEAEALKHSLDGRNREQRRIDQLPGRDQSETR